MIYRRQTDVLTMWSACTRVRMLLNILSISAERFSFAWKFNIAYIVCNNSFFNDHVISSAYWMSHVKFLCMVITIWYWNCGGDRCDDDDGRHVCVLNFCSCDIRYALELRLRWRSFHHGIMHFWRYSNVYAPYANGYNCLATYFCFTFSSRCCSLFTNMHRCV